NHAVALRPQRRQALGHLACQALDAADLRADGGAGVDRDCGRAGARPQARRRAARRRPTPAPSRSTPAPAASETFSPVNGSVVDVADAVATGVVLVVVLVALGVALEVVATD